MSCFPIRLHPTVVFSYSMASHCSVFLFDCIPLSCFPIRLHFNVVSSFSNTILVIWLFRFVNPIKMKVFSMHKNLYLWVCVHFKYAHFEWAFNIGNISVDMTAFLSETHTRFRANFFATVLWAICSPYLSSLEYFSNYVSYNFVSKFAWKNSMYNLIRNVVGWALFKIINSSRVL